MMPDHRSDAQLIVNKAINEFARDLPAAVGTYLSEVLEWNRVVGLVSRKDPAGACERLLFESIELARVLEAERVNRLADVGSGAGFPGIVWAILAPAAQVVLIERREKRALFLDRACRSLEIANATVLAEDVRDVSARPGLQASFDLVATMAVGDPARVGPLVEPLLKPGGRAAGTIRREATPPARIGKDLQMASRTDGKFGCYVVYRRGV